jgi:hypothetical protein
LPFIYLTTTFAPWAVLGEGCSSARDPYWDPGAFICAKTDLILGRKKALPNAGKTIVNSWKAGFADALMLAKDIALSCFAAGLRRLVT